LEPLTKLLGFPCESDYALRAEDLRREGIRCSARTLRRYYRAWQRAGKDRLALANDPHRLLQPAGGGLLPGVRTAGVGLSPRATCFGQQKSTLPI
jgi:hypothetical protein